jgi:hypothetical protein
MGFDLKEKLKSLKGVIKQWSKAEFGNIDARIQLLIEEIKAANMRAEQSGLSEIEAAMRRKSFGDLWHLLKSKDSQMFQRSRAKWLKNGDEILDTFMLVLRLEGIVTGLLLLRWMEFGLRTRVGSKR